ncbi:MAG: triose-phosphate isomerase [Chloroflexota bacterium]
MMRKLFIAGNWKMNKTAAEAVAFLSGIKDELNAIEGIDVAVCPPALAIPAVAELLKGTHIGVGAQNMYFEESGAYTGELAANMLTPFCQYVILGHSERREFFGETNEGVNKKIKAALAHGLTPIVCCGESLAQNQASETHEFVSGQIKAAFGDLTAEQTTACVIAYEPIWAIGTGLTATVEQAGGIIGSTVRATIREMFGDDVAEQVRIQYGGSVSEKNSAELMAHPDIDGALVGGASLKATFVDLVRNAL